MPSAKATYARPIFREHCWLSCATDGTKQQPSASKALVWEHTTFILHIRLNGRFFNNNKKHLLLLAFQTDDLNNQLVQFSLVLLVLDGST